MLVKEKYPRVPYGITVHGQDEIDAVVNVLKTSTQMGPNVRNFENQIAKQYGKTHGVMVNSGSSALMLAVELLDLPSGSEVITPVLTFSTSISYIVRNNLVPAFVDIEEGSYVIDVNKVEEMITPSTRAILAPHLIGNIIDWRKLTPIIKKYDLRVIEDSADTIGATIGDKPTGIYADISTTSFYGSHIINCAGNGGMLCVDNETFSEDARLLRSWGRSSSVFVESESIENRFNVDVDGIPYDAKFVFEKIGHNLEPSELGAAFGLIQLKKLKENLSARQDFFRRQYEFFSEFAEFFILPKQTNDVSTGWLAFPITLRETAPFSRRDFQIFLEKRNIQTRVIFTGNIIRQPGFAKIRMKTSRAGYPEADKVTKGGVLLACHHGLGEEMLEHMHNSVKKFLGRF